MSVASTGTTAETEKHSFDQEFEVETTEDIVADGARPNCCSSANLTSCWIQPP